MQEHLKLCASDESWPCPVFGCEQGWSVDYDGGCRIKEGLPSGVALLSHIEETDDPEHQNFAESRRHWVPVVSKYVKDLYTMVQS